MSREASADGLARVDAPEVGGGGAHLEGHRGRPALDAFRRYRQELARRRGLRLDPAGKGGIAP